jgi:hypothetical protein
VFLPVFVVKLLVLSLFVEALICGVLCGVFISLFPVTFLWACTHYFGRVYNYVHITSIALILRSATPMMLAAVVLSVLLTRE